MKIMVYGTPKPQGSKALGRRRDGTIFMRESNRGHKGWRETVVECLRLFKTETIDAPTYVSLRFHTPHLKKPKAYPVTRSSYDIDKLSRTILDALTIAGIIRDDSQVICLHAHKEYSDTPGVEITVRPIGE